MDLSRLLEIILNFIAQWAGTTLPRVVAAFLGILICVIIIAAVWDRRIRSINASFGMALGLLLIGVAIDTRLMHLLVRTTYFTRIRILMSIISFVVLVITIESIRRSKLQERYALLWVATGLIILATAFFPQLLDFIGLIFGTQYVTSVVGVLFGFFLLITFHFSIALSGFLRHQTRIAQRFAILEQQLDDLDKRLQENQLNIYQGQGISRFDESKAGEKRPAIPLKQIEERHFNVRRFKGSQVAAPIIIMAAMVAVFAVGISTPQVMIGDEVTHFYMMTEQSKLLSRLNFIARIPSAWGAQEVRRYPHSFLWHYGGAILYRISGGSFMAIQMYQALFLGQLLSVAYLMARKRKGVETRSAMLYLLTIASVPMCLIFSVTFYQDVPMTAQAVTSFYMLDRRRWLTGTFFMALAIGLKVTAVLFLPIFFILMLYRIFKCEKRLKGIFLSAVSAAILMGFVTFMGWTIRTYAHSEFYPYKKISKAYRDAKQLITEKKPPKSPKNKKERETGADPDRVTPYEVEIIANHPGDLRRPVNFLVYGGFVLWIVMCLGILGIFIDRHNRLAKPLKKQKTRESSLYLLMVGGIFILASAWFLRTAPDARFFLPGLPFLLLPVAEYAVKLPRPKLIIALIASLAILQGGHVLAKTYRLRHVTPEIRQAISYLKENQPSPRTVFMYPEGNYRLFPVPHNWYLGYKLREFWRADNDTRIQMLHHFGIGAIVVKKHLIAEVDPEIINLGVYPTFFVEDLRNDARFENVFENKGVVIFKVPL